MDSAARGAQRADAMDLAALHKEILAVRGHQIALGMVVAAMLKEFPAQDVERLFEVAEVYLSNASLPKEVATDARAEIRALRSSYRTS